MDIAPPLPTAASRPAVDRAEHRAGGASRRRGAGFASRLASWTLLPLVLFAGAPAVVSAAAQPATAQPAPAAPVIVVLGDSLSAAYGIRVEEGWVALLQQRLRAQGYGHRVVNASVSGETTGGGLARLPRVLAAHRPQLVIVELGGNDGLRGVPIPTMRANLERLVRLSREAGADVLLLGMRIPSNYGAQYTEQFHASFGEVARAERVPLVPFFLERIALEERFFLPDGIHPNASAQPLLLDTVWPALEPRLEAGANAGAAQRPAAGGRAPTR